MRRTSFDLVRSGLGIGILVVALCFQMLPFFLLVIVMAHALGISGEVSPVIFPILFFATVFALCWLASKRTSKRTRMGSPWRPPKVGRRATKPVRRESVLLKTRAERYRDLKDILGRIWR